MRHILIAEDDAFTTTVYTSRLKKDGYEVEIAPDGKRAWTKIKSRAPDLLLLDMDLPYINGYDLLKMIRENQAIKNLPVIIISNTKKGDLSHDISTLNVKQYLVKIETSLDEMVRVVKEILQ